MSSFLWILSVASAGWLASALGLRWLRPRRDYFFLLLMGQAVIYLHVAPALAAPGVSSDLQALYVAISLLSLVLFEVPSVLFYSALMRGTARTGPLPTPAVVKPSGTRTVALAGFAAGYAAWFVWTAIRYQLVFIRLGPEGVLDRYAELPFLTWAAYRLFADTGGILGAGLLLVTLRAPTNGIRSLAAAGTFVVYAAYAPFVLINSRLDSILMGAVALGVVLHWHRFFQRRPWAIPASFALLFLVAGYSYRVVNTMRLNFLDAGGVRLEWFNPFYRDPSPVRFVGGDSPLAMRLNGVDLMAQMTPGALREGFALGAAWQGTVAPLVWTVIDRERADQLKQSYATDSKVYLMRRYTALSSPDYYSSALLDGYGNFGPAGMLLAALALSGLSAFAARQMLLPARRYAPFVGLWTMYIVLSFEQPLVSTFTNFVRYAPMLAVLLLLNPIRLGADPRPPERPAPL